MITYLGVLYLSNMNIDDIAYREDAIIYIDLKSDIDLACKQLNINPPLSVDEAKEISDYINRKYYDAK